MKAFFDHVRRFFGPLSQPQVDGFMVILNATLSLPMKHRAYVLATVFHETAKTMQPIAEYGKGKGKPYGKPAGPHGKAYYGRGYVQLTWLANYQKAALATGRDLVANPDLAMEPDIASVILVRGMTEGWFTGKKLSDFTSYTAMRAIVNGTDKAALIAGHAEVFEDALIAQAMADAEAAKTAADDVATDPAKTPSATLAKGVGAIVVAAVMALLAWVMGVFGGN
jgi:putative chitinase